MHVFKTHSLFVHDTKDDPISVKHRKTTTLASQPSATLASQPSLGSPILNPPKDLRPCPYPHLPHTIL